MAGRVADRDIAGCGSIFAASAHGSWVGTGPRGVVRASVAHGQVCVAAQDQDQEEQCRSKYEVAVGMR